MQRKATVQIFVVLVFVFMGAVFAQADPPPNTASITLTAEIASTAELTLSGTTVDFPASLGSPTVTGANMTSPNTINVTANLRTGGTGATLYALATDDLNAGGGKTIDITTVTSTISGTAGTGTFFTTGAVNMSKTTSGALLGQGGSGSYTGTFTFAMPNLWTYKTGNYTTTLNYTLTAP